MVIVATRAKVPITVFRMFRVMKRFILLPTLLVGGWWWDQYSWLFSFGGSRVIERSEIVRNPHGL